MTDDIFERGPWVKDTSAFDIMPALRLPFPTTLIKKNYQGFDFAPPQHVIDRLNDVLGTGWDMEVISIDIVEDEVICHGRMTIDGHRKDGIGTDSIQRETNAGKKMVDCIGKAYKSAYSNCLKLCAKQFGVGNHLWGGELMPETSANSAPDPAPAPDVAVNVASDTPVEDVNPPAPAPPPDLPDPPWNKADATAAILEKVDKMYGQVTPGIATKAITELFSEAGIEVVGEDWPELCLEITTRKQATHIFNGLKRRTHRPAPNDEE
jgi:hypothetical protein